jgi:hypothetical protein
MIQITKNKTPPISNEPCIKRGKQDGWTDEMIALSEEGLIVLNFHDPKNINMYEDNLVVQCIPCRDSSWSTHGVIHLRCAFDPEKWEQHCNGKRHKEDVQ